MNFIKNSLKTPEEKNRLFNSTIEDLIKANKEFFAFADASSFLENTHHLTQFFYENASLEDYDQQQINNVLYTANYQSVFIVKMQETLNLLLSLQQDPQEPKEMEQKEVLFALNTISGVPTVSMRELYTFLKPKSNFKNWSKQMFGHGFKENKNFIPILEQSDKKKPDYALTILMAKHISMLQSTPQGREAVNYFLFIEENYTNLLKDFS